MTTFITGITVGIILMIVLSRVKPLGGDDIGKTEHLLREDLKKKTLDMQALILADDFYPEMTYRRNRLEQMRFDMLYIDNDFTREWTADERKEIASVCSGMLEEERKNFVDNLDSGTEKAETGDNRQGKERTTWQPRIELISEVSHE